MAREPIPFDQGLFLMHYHKGKELFDVNLLQQAREELEAANKIRPSDEKVLNLLGMTYYKMELLQEAEEMYLRLTLSNPDIHTLQSNLGLIRLKLNKLDLAEQSLGHALDLQPSNPKVHFYLGLLYEKKEQWNDALIHFEEAKAEKMASRIREILERKQTEEQNALPFQIVEVVEERPEETSESVSDLVTRAIEAEEDGFDAPKEDTARMLRHDLVETMERLEQEKDSFDDEEKEEDVAAVVSPPVEPGNIQEEWKKWIENTGKYPVQQYIETIRADEPSEYEPASPEDNLPEIHNEEEHIPDWEEAALGNSVSQEENFLPPLPVIEQPFFLAEEMAADISTFLAQSRMEQHEDVFALDAESPQLPSLTAITQEVDLPEFHSEETTVQQRIPTPEEIEQEIAEVQNEVVSPDPEEIPESPAYVTVEMGHPTIEELEEEVVEFEILQEPEIPSDVEQSDVEQSKEEEPSAEMIPEPNFEVSETVAQSDQLTESSTPVLKEPIEADADQAVEEQKIPDTNGFEEEIPEVSEEPDAEMPASTGFLTPSFEVINPVITQVELTQELDESESKEPQETKPAEELPSCTEPELQEVHEKPIEEVLVTTPENEPEISAPEPIHSTGFFAQRGSEFPANLDQFSRDRFYVQPLIGADRFLLIDPHLLEVILSDQLICRIGTISSYTGNLQFSSWNTDTSLIQVSGSGVLFLADRRKEIFLLSLNHELMFIEASHLLVAQSALKLEPLRMQHKSGKAFSVVKISGRGTFALTCQTKPLTLNIHQGLPANIPSNAVIAWSGNLTSQVLEDEEIRKILMAPEDEDLFLRYSGSGDVVVEQGGLWGDRRTKRS